MSRFVLLLSPPAPAESLLLPICENIPKYKASTALRIAGSRPRPAEQYHDAEDSIVEEVEITGHIIDSLILPKVLDTITANGGKFRITNIAIGQARNDPSYAVVEVRAPSESGCSTSSPRSPTTAPSRPPSKTAGLAAADMDGAFPGRLLQYDQPANRNSPRRHGSSRRPGDGLRRRGRRD